MKAKITLTEAGAIALKAHQVGIYGHAGIARGHQTLRSAKEHLRNRPVSSFRVVESTLAEFPGDLKERAAVGLGLRKKSARFIESVEMI